MENRIRVLPELAQLCLAHGITPARLEDAAQRNDFGRIAGVTTEYQLRRLCGRWGIKVQS